jgi:hypothetical protein
MSIYWYFIVKNFSKEEYLKLIQELLDNQYDNEEEDNSLFVWLPAESEIKEKIKIKELNNGFIDGTNVKSIEFKKLLTLNGNVRFGLFMIVRTSKMQCNGSIITNLYIYEDHKANSNISSKVDVIKDSRFISRVWKKYFNSYKEGVDIPIDTVVEIARYLQVLQKLAAFT